MLKENLGRSNPPQAPTVSCRSAPPSAIRRSTASFAQPKSYLPLVRLASNCSGSTNAAQTQERRKDMHCAVAVNVALVPGGSRMNRMRACDAVRRAAGPHRQVQPFLSGCGLGSRRISPSIDRIYVQSRSDSTLRGELPTARCGPRITFVSSKWTTRKVDQVPNTEAFANLPQVGSGGRKETAQQSIPAEPLHPLMPTLGVAIQPLKMKGHAEQRRMRWCRAKPRIDRAGQEITTCAVGVVVLWDQ